ncbi:MAG: hypothetical protein HKO66_01475, partial [Saprospiraceae bacterium]|nr:hypothetical protein [Saprospiraceae bacterium]
QYSPLSNNNQKLTSNKVFSMHLDPIYPDSIIWVGTNLGVDRLNFITNEVTNISTKNGLPNNVIYGILADKRNNLWMSSNRGLFVVDPKDNSLVMTFDADDGLQHLEFNKYGSGRTKSGIFFFQGIRGMNYFNPEDFYLDTKPSRLIFTSMRLSNEDVKIKRNKVDNNKSDFQLESSLEYMPKISLPHTERIITFEFSLLDLSNPKKNKYRYKLKGQNENWIELGNQNNVILTNLDPGSYELQVQAIGTHSNWESQEANLNFTIQPPWWKTWWFKLIILGLICLLIYLFISYKRNQAIQLELLRNRISRDLHDDIGSTLSSISLFGTLALKNLKSQNSTVEKMLDKINSGALQVMESLNDIVWTISTDNNKVEDLINRMRAYISGFEDTDEWQIDFNFNENILNNTLTMVQRRNIYLIFKESVNNAIKYSSGHRIKVYIAIRNNLFELIMTDDGKGFNYEEVKKMNTLGGNGIKNMKNRAKEIKGNLEFDSIKDIGTKVKFTFNTKSER